MATQIAAQMYTIREHTKTPADIAKSCKRLSDLGFGAVQPSALGPIEPEELKKILDDNGLAAVATHQPLEALKDVERAVAYHQALDCKLTAVGGFGFDGATRSDWENFAREYSEVGEKLNARGLRAGYHNHSHELAPFATDPAKIDPTQNPLNLLAAKLDQSVWFEVDTYWIAHGGGDPAAWIGKLKGRVPAVHVKDMTVTPKREQKMCEVGRGNLNWPAILEACKEAGTQWYLIERDSGDLDPFESLKISLDNLKAMGLD